MRGIGESNVYSKVKSGKCQTSNYKSDIASSLEPVFEKRSISPNHLLVAYCMSSRVNAFSLQYLANSEHGKGNIEGSCLRSVEEVRVVGGKQEVILHKIPSKRRQWCKDLQWQVNCFALRHSIIFGCIVIHNLAR